MAWRVSQRCWRFVAAADNPAIMSAAVAPTKSFEDPLFSPLLAGDRRALAQAITLVESTRSDHRARADALLGALLPHTGRSVRLGITGVPGVGKSTFIECFGLSLLERGRSLAVLAIDPSSKRAGGSILGDKTRMEELSRRTSAFIRPSPAGSTLGGVARRTREAMLLIEAAGFDTVLVETVGVGQSETAVADMVDMFIVLLLPGGGDDLQGIKRGVIELADLIVVNKADGDMLATAKRSAADYQHALRLLRSPTAGWTPEVATCSAIAGNGVAEIWDIVGRFRQAVGENGIARRRAEQARAWMWNEVGETLLSELRRHPEIKRQMGVLEREVETGHITPAAAARRMLEIFHGR
jgi:LAO/AO transport system kinase